ncbi:MAG: hypothetical protein KA059_05135 [Elusimicrobiales bacterium]|nr:hypothetical protein [Elusimicrobiales bacterium]
MSKKLNSFLGLLFLILLSFSFYKFLRLNPTNNFYLCSFFDSDTELADSSFLDHSSDFHSYNLLISYSSLYFNKNIVFYFLVSIAVFYFKPVLLELSRMRAPPIIY